MSLRWTFIGTLLCVLTAGCDGDLSGSGPRGTSNLDIPETKRIERLNARQFFRALEVTTGQSWSRADQYAATLGQPDFDQVVQESNDISISFVKLAGDAAREVCRDAVNADLELETQADRIISRDVDSMDPMDPSVERNIRYLVLRFHGIYITDDLDSRLDPWVSLIRSELPEEPEERLNQMPDRWKAVCVGLISHPDFMTY